MNIYRIEDIGLLEYRIRFCLYCYLQMTYKINELKLAKKNGFQPQAEIMTGLEVQVFFYKENFHKYLSELYSFFHKKKDQKILVQLELDDTKREIHREVRHGLEHIGKKDALPIIELLNMEREELLKNDGFNKQVRDFLKIIRYSKRILNEPESESIYKESVNRALLEVMKLFPRGMMNKKFFDELLG